MFSAIIRNLRAHFMALLIVIVATACSEGGSGQAIGDTSLGSTTPAITSARETVENPSEAREEPSKQDAEPALFEQIFIALPSLPTGSLSHHTMTTTGAGIVIAGGANQNGNTVGDILIFDIKIAKFVTLPVLLTDARQQHTASAVPGFDGILGTADDGVVVFGGCQIAQDNPAGLQLLRSVELIIPDPNGDGFYDDAMVQQLESLSYELAGHCTELIHSSSTGTTQDFLIMGGVTPGLTHDQPQCPTNESWIYQLQVNSLGEYQGQIIEIEHPRYARQYHSLTETPGPDGIIGTRDDQFMVLGGRGFEVLGESQQAILANDLADSARAIETVEIFEPFTRRWRVASVDGPLRLLEGRFRHKAVLSDQGVLVFGGVDMNDEVHKECFRLELDPVNPERLFAVSIGALNQGRELPEVVALSDNRWLILGGFERRTGRAVGAVLDTVELYDAERQPAFQLLPQRMVRPRVYHRAKLLDGRVLIVGGFANHYHGQGPDAEFVHKTKLTANSNQSQQTNN